MLFDIHTERAAQQTLLRITGIPVGVWEENIRRERDYELQDYFVEAMIEEYGTRQLPKSYVDWLVESKASTVSLVPCITE